MPERERDEAPATPIRVMSWNIRRRVPNLGRRSPDRWILRAPAVRALLQDTQPTLLGVQEALPEQVAWVRQALGPQYASVGRGRGSRGTGEAIPVFFDAERLELLHWTQVALSAHPTTPGSRSWGNLIPRVAVTAQFRDRETSREFLAVNTHLDHLSARSRLRSAEQLREIVRAADLPTVLTGDFNAPPASAPLNAILEAGLLHDSWRHAARHESDVLGTYAKYREPKQDGRRIDWVLASAHFRVDSAEIIARRYGGRWASDHLPVLATLSRIEGETT